jgi:alpha-beta hydrolase superfamily lysophospholipase
MTFHSQSSGYGWWTKAVRGKVPQGVAGLLLVMLVARAAFALGTVPFVLRGRTLALHVSGPATGLPVIVASGDGGWIHLGPHVSDVLARAGYFVVGLDSRQYLAAFTVGRRGLAPDDVVRDFRAVIDFASRRSRAKPVLVGVSEGAGLAVLAASSPSVRESAAGVVALGLPDRNELAWRWSDAVIYVTKGVPDEPLFKVADVIDRVAPLPLAAIHATGDEFVPVAEIQRLMGRAGEPKRLWTIPASDHRFSSNEREFDARLADALAWVRANAPR